MQISLEELEDLLIIGEANAIKEEKEFSVDLILKNPDQTDTAEEEPISRVGYKLSFRPEPQEIRIGVSSAVLDESRIEVMYRTQKLDKTIEDWDYPTSIQELLEENINFRNLDFSHANFAGKTYTDKQKLFADFGIDILATVTIKIPSTILVKFKKISNKKYGTVSNRIRTLIESDLENEIKMAVRKEIFK